MTETVRQVMNAGDQRAEMGSVGGAACGERQRPERPAVKSAVKSDHVLALGMIARELESGFHGFRSRVGEIYFLGRGTGSQAVEFFRQLDHRLIVIIATADMKKFLSLLFDRL